MAKKLGSSKSASHKTRNNHAGFFAAFIGLLAISSLATVPINCTISYGTWRHWPGGQGQPVRQQSPEQEADFAAEGSFGAPVAVPTGVWPQGNGREGLSRVQWGRPVGSSSFGTLEHSFKDGSVVRVEPSYQPTASLFERQRSKLPHGTQRSPTSNAAGYLYDEIEALSRLRQSLDLPKLVASAAATSGANDRASAYEYLIDPDSEASKNAAWRSQLLANANFDSKYPISYSLDQEVSDLPEASQDKPALEIVSPAVELGNFKRSSIEQSDQRVILSSTESSLPAAEEQEGKVFTTLIEDDEFSAQPEAKPKPVAGLKGTNPALQDGRTAGKATDHSKMSEQITDDQSSLRSIMSWLKGQLAGSGVWLANSLSSNRQVGLAGNVTKNGNQLKEETKTDNQEDSKQVLEASKPESQQQTEGKQVKTSGADGGKTIDTEQSDKSENNTSESIMLSEADEKLEPSKREQADKKQQTEIPVKSASGEKQQRRDPLESHLAPSEQRASLFRQSTLAIPLEESTDEQAGPNSILDHYVFAPFNHFRQSTTASLTGASEISSSQSDQHSEGLMRKSSYLTTGRFHPGDAVFSSYSAAPMGPIYHTRHPNEHISYFHTNQPNDLYFLVMVGSFCVMAMAVVLTAGLFAYRVQQKSKNSQELDYPTYGVVGPNNMSSKLGGLSGGVGHGGANLVGYLGGNGHHLNMGGFLGGSSAKGSSGCSKQSQSQSPDLYSGNDSGVGGPSSKASSKKSSSDCGSSGTARSNFLAGNQNAARMYHYQHQKQQMISSDRTSTGRHTSASDLDSEEEIEDGNYTVYECPGLASAHEMEIKNPLFNDDRSP